jgi:hypothetical protein
MNFENVSWRPAKIGGSIFETNVFEIKDENSLVISPTKLFIILVPIVIVVLNILPFLSNIIFQKSPSIIIVGVVICFDIIMLIVYLKGLTIVELNKKNDTLKKVLV